MFVELTTQKDRAAHAKIFEFDKFAQAFGRVGRELEVPVLDWQKIEAYRAEFSLMKAELFEPAAPLVQSNGAAGFIRKRLGPGEAYWHRRETEGYANWSQAVVQAMR